MTGFSDVLPEPVGGHAFLAQVDIEPEWIVPGLIPENSLGMLAGPPGSAKTFAVMRFLAEATRGLKESLLLEEECSGWDLRRRIRAAGIDPLQLRILHQASARIDSPDWVEHLKRHLDGVKFAILDPLSNLHGLDDREQDAMQTIWGILSELQRNSGCALLVVHHTVKTSWVGELPQLADIRGSSVIAGRLDWAYVLKPLILKEQAEESEEELQAAQQTSLFELHCVKMRGWAQPPPRVAELQNAVLPNHEVVPALVFQDGTPKQAKRKQRDAGLRLKVLSTCRNTDCESANAIWKAMGTNRTDTMAVIAELKRTGELVVEEGSKFYRPSKVVLGLVSTAGTGGTAADTRYRSGVGVVPGTVPPRGGTSTTPPSGDQLESEVVPETTVMANGLPLTCMWPQCSEPRHQDLAWCLGHWTSLQAGAR